MDMIVAGHSSVSILVQEQSQVGEARRAAASFSNELGFSETLAGKIGIVTSELASNLMKHTTGGELILRPLADRNRRGLEVMSVDAGPGFDVDKCLRDGYSSAGTAGNGLGSVRRLSSCLEIFSFPGQGTVLVAHLWDSPGKSVPHSLELGAVSLPMKGEKACGDAWIALQSGRGHRVLVADGLGHGEHAAEASQTAVRIFSESSGESLEQLFQSLHQALRSTRGAAMAVAEIDHDRELLRYVGVGNIAGVILTGPVKKHLVSQNGTVGVEMSRVTEFRHPWSKDSLLILHSDGLASKWKIDAYAGLQAQHPSLVAGVLYRDFNRQRDDVTVIAAREARL